MGLQTAIVATLLLTQATTTKPTDVLAEAQKVANKLTTRNERAIAFLALAQAENQIGDHKAAANALQTGWTAFEKGSNKDLSKGDAFDIQTLFDESDLSMLPIDYAYEFVVVGDLTSARKSAMTLGDDPLADSYRQGLGQRLRAKFPEAVETVTLTTAQQARRTARKSQIRDALAAIRAKTEPAESAFGLREAAGELTRLGAGAEGLALLRESADVSQKIENPAWKVVGEAQLAMAFWNAGAKGEAKELLARAEKDFAAITDEKGRRAARFSVEQTKESMGLPNQAAEALEAINPPAASSPSGPISTPPPSPALMSSGGNSNSPYNLISEAEQAVQKGDAATAKRALRRIKVAPAGDGWWLVLAGEMQTKLGDREIARRNLAEGSRRFLAQMRPSPPYLDREEFNQLVRIAQAQVANGDRPAGLQTLSQGIQRLAGTKRWIDVPLMGDGGGQIIRHDRQSPTLHAGAVAMAKAGFYANAVALARTIPSPAHRAIALAASVRYGLPPRP